MSVGPAISASHAHATPTPAAPPAVPVPWGTWAVRAAVFAWVGGLVILPIAALVARGAVAGSEAWLEVVTGSGRDALVLSLVTSALAAALNGVFGLLVAWALVRWEFPGRRVLEALVDLPLAVPTLVAGILLVALYGPQTPIGGFFSAAGFPIVFAKPGIVLALLFVTLPFVVRSVEPVLRELDPAEEEAALMLGASRPLTFFRVLLPPLLPALAAGMIQTFARSVAEFGSLAVVSGNIPHRTLSAPVYVLGEVEGGNIDGAAAYSLALLALALFLHPLSGWIARLGGNRHG